ncbi:MAG: TOPRIM nucleotidyl transferase/hydrolase domain-containing protein [Nitrososphaera sp.]
MVVEGDSDVAALWAMQTFMEQKWDELGVVVVPVAGKNNIDRAVVAFQGFGIPTYFMFDGDKAKAVDNKATAGTINANRTLLSLGGAGVLDFPATGLAPTCAFFEDDIET